jgi:hypothetical protein
MKTKLAVIAGLAMVSIASGAEATPAEATARLDYWMRTFKQSVLTPAAASGDKFPAYERWLSVTASAVRGGMKPERLSPKPLVMVPHDVRDLLAASDAATVELATYIPPPPQTKDLEAIAAHEETTQPKRLQRLLLRIFYMMSPTDRSAAADRLREAYALP